MSTTKRGAFPAGRRRKTAASSNRRVAWSSEPFAPVASAWRLRNADLPFQHVKCPRCRGWKLVENVRSGDGDVARWLVCDDGEGQWINVRDEGFAPPELQARLGASLPVGDLIGARDLVLGDRATPLDPARNRWWDRTTWLPWWDDIDFALRSLKACGFGPEADAFKQAVGRFWGKASEQLAASAAWREISGDLREQLLRAIEECRQSGGR